MLKVWVGVGFLSYSDKFNNIPSYNKTIFHFRLLMKRYINAKIGEHIFTPPILKQLK